MGLLVLGVLLFTFSLLLIGIVLIQRGRGGGLSGAFGGAGGQSAFGAKAGDTFTRITVAMSMIWILLCMVTIRIYNAPVKQDAKQDQEKTEVVQPRTPPGAADETDAAKSGGDFNPDEASPGADGVTDGPAADGVTDGPAAEADKDEGDSDKQENSSPQGEAAQSDEASGSGG